PLQRPARSPLGNRRGRGAGEAVGAPDPLRRSCPGGDEPRPYEAFLSRIVPEDVLTTIFSPPPLRAPAARCEPDRFENDTSGNSERIARSSSAPVTVSSTSALQSGGSVSETSPPELLIVISPFVARD